MDRSLPLFVLGLIFGGGLGFAIAASMGFTFDDHDHSNPAHHGADVAGDHAMMHEAPLEVLAAEAPELSVTLTPDPMAGYNLQVTTRNFTFSPMNASGAHVAGEGHAHVYVNGRKVGRLYGEWMHLDALPKGDVEVAVTLNANDHRPLAVGGTPITASQTITVE
ncbi:MAG: hypothetical protein HKN30_16125 [Sulfitobacter sp.]|nr:hypothetical protein [Sulfitobacter sp.]